MDLISWGQFITLLMLAVAVSMDAFSLGIGMGMSGLRLRHVLKISLTVGLFHLIMPLSGMVIGHFLSHIIGGLATMMGGWLLVLLGANMFWSSLSGNQGQVTIPARGMKLALFAFSVSIDALSIGFSLGLFSVDTWLTVILFGFWGTLMALAGLLLGKNVGRWLGDYGEALGGFILFVMGIKFLF